MYDCVFLLQEYQMTLNRYTQEAREGGTSALWIGRPVLKRATVWQAITISNKIRGRLRLQLKHCVTLITFWNRNPRAKRFIIIEHVQKRNVLERNQNVRLRSGSSWESGCNIYVYKAAFTRRRFHPNSFRDRCVPGLPQPQDSSGYPHRVEGALWHIGSEWTLYTLQALNWFVYSIQFNHY